MGTTCHLFVLFLYLFEIVSCMGPSLICNLRSFCFYFYFLSSEIAAMRQHTQLIPSIDGLIDLGCVCVYVCRPDVTVSYFSSWLSILFSFSFKFFSWFFYFIFWAPTPCKCWDLNLGPQEEGLVLLNTELSLQPFLFFTFVWVTALLCSPK